MSKEGITTQAPPKIRYATVTIEGVTPLQQSREYASQYPRGDKETHEDYKKRTWRLKAHTDAKGNVYHPGSAFKQAMIAAAQYTGEKIPTGGSKTYTQKFESALSVDGDLYIGHHVDDAEMRSVFGNSKGERRGKKGGRVWVHFPTFPKWGGTLKFLIFDQSTNEAVFAKYMSEAGAFIGVGTWRPHNGGEYGRFKVISIKWD